MDQFSHGRTETGPQIALIAGFPVRILCFDKTFQGNRKFLLLLPGREKNLLIISHKIAPNIR